MSENVSGPEAPAGTTAAGLAAGCPQLLLPMAWDQPDNAARVRRLGAGDWLPPRRRTGTHLAAALVRLTTPGVRERCQVVATRCGEADGLDTAAGWVEELARRATAAR